MPEMFQLVNCWWTDGNSENSEFKAGTNLGAAQKAVGRISMGPSRAWKMVDVFISPVTQKVLHRNDSIRHHRIQNTSSCMKLGPNWSKPYCSVQPFPRVTLLPAKWMISGNKISMQLLWHARYRKVTLSSLCKDKSVLKRVSGIDCDPSVP